MKVLGKKEFILINFYIGLTIRYARLSRKMSQLELGTIIGLDNTSIGRIERAEHFSSWDKLILVCNYLDLDFCNLLQVNDKKSLLQLIEDCYKLEDKLNLNKEIFYQELRQRVKNIK